MSLSSTYLSRKALLVEKLEDKGVTADTSMGLTTLINKIDDIPSGPDVLTLSVDKSILSYADSDSCTASVLLVNANNQPLANKEVTITVLHGSTTVDTDTITTDSDGEASYTYNSQGAGDLTIQAAYGILLQETYVTDCTNYDPCTVNADKWTLQSGRSASCSNDGMAISSNSWGGVIFKPQILLPSIVEFEIVSITGSYSTYINLMDNDTNTDSNNHSYLSLEFKTNNTVVINGTTYNLANRGTGKWKFKVETTGVEIYLNDTLFATVTKTIGDYWFTWGNRGNFTFKDVKIKAL